MATWDAADLLLRCQDLAARPTTDAAMAAAQWYRRLTEAQVYWMGVLATHVPMVNFGAPVLLATADSGETYDFTVFPLGHVEVRASRSGRLLRIGPEWDAGVDFVHEGNKLRVPGGKTKTFSDGPYARYVPSPATISASVAPVMNPDWGRMLLVFRAVATWADQGGFRDPKPFKRMEREFWLGPPDDDSQTGLLGALKTQFFLSGAEAWSAGAVGRWYDGLDTGSGYQAVGL